MFVSCTESSQQKIDSSYQDTTPATKADSIDAISGLVVAGDYQIVRQQCMSCHSAKLITQNKATREGWEQMIRWMQETQKLWDLGESEDKILDYLATYYAPVNQGRRAMLTVEEWYPIE